MGKTLRNPRTGLRGKGCEVAKREHQGKGGVLTPKNPKKSQKIPKKPNPNLPILV